MRDGMRSSLYLTTTPLPRKEKFNMSNRDHDLNQLEQEYKSARFGR